ncbi:MAG: PPOX class F420-dependent oxidoreductase [Chloroflexi bacterium]|nr:PPOX class F420-dependent oxidoreductase [Chloroflexota bacterium]
MITPELREFAMANNKAVLTTFRRGGAAQMSIVVSTPAENGVSFTTTEDRAKYKNLARDSRCSLLISKEDWWGYVVLEGNAHLVTQENTPRADYLKTCRTIYRQISGEHSNWDEYDQAMLDDHRAVITIVPDRVYGTAL